MTMKEADDIIRVCKEDTAYFDGRVTATELIDVLHKNFGLGLADSLVITASLVKAGADLK